MVNIKVDGLDAVKNMIAAAPKQAGRAIERALDTTVKAGKAAVGSDMPKSFDRPTPYTLNSVKHTPTQNHNMQASVWIAKPNRMEQAFLVPQVMGGNRKLKGFERALGTAEFVPAGGAKLDRYGNISGKDIVQILSVLGGLNRYAGDIDNITDASRKKNIKERDFFVITQRRGKLFPGIYRRYQTGVGFGAKTKRTFADRSKAYQKGRIRGKFASVIKARGIKPIMYRGRTGKPYVPRLDFYGIVTRVYDEMFQRTFEDNFLKALLKVRG